MIVGKIVYYNEYRSIDGRSVTQAQRVNVDRRGIFPSLVACDDMCRVDEQHGGGEYAGARRFSRTIPRCEGSSSSIDRGYEGKTGPKTVRENLDLREIYTRKK